MPRVSVRYIVDDVDAAIDFYCSRLGFDEVMHPAPTFAMLAHGDLRLVLSAPGGGQAADRRCPTGPATPGGWNRFQLEVADIESTVAELRAHGAQLPQRDRHRRRRQAGPRRGPAGNPVELFEPTLAEAKLSPTG